MIAVHSGKRGKYNNAATGKFFPSHPEKYRGRKSPEFKSGLELRMMQYLDKNPAIVAWEYEPKPIMYYDASFNPPKPRRYYIDFVAIVRSGPCQKTVWIEVKPTCETVKPKNPKNTKALALWNRNQSKWQAAIKLAKSKGCEFHIITEQQLN